MENIKNVGIIGTGQMGVRIGKHLALKKYRVKFYDVNSDALKKAEKDINDFLKDKGVENENLTYHDALGEAVVEMDLVIEAAPEKLDLKKEIFSEIDEKAPSQTIIATNSSSIPVSRLEGSVKAERRDKLLNIHFYHPLAIPMADIMKGTQTSNEVFSEGKKWLESIGIKPLVVKKECLGFVFNRIWHAIKMECLKIWAGGYADMKDVDEAWKIFSGMENGPFKSMDTVGLDVVYDIEMEYHQERGDPKPPQKLKNKVEKGELGVKTGAGFYDYEDK